MNSSYNRILVAVDGSKYAEWTFRKGIEMAKRNKAELHILYVFDVRYYPSDNAALKKRAENDGIELLNRYKEEVESHHDVEKVETILKFGSPKVLVTKTAEDIEADLILCGASGLNAVEQILLGGVTESIVRNAGCDVLVVKRPKNIEQLI
jgi:nucleotide-binding universal stress UspA family protein